MRRPERRKRLHEFGRIGNDLALGHVDMQAHVLRGGGEPALFRVVHFLKEMKALLVKIDQPPRDADGIMQPQFTLVDDVDLGCEARMVGAFKIGAPHADAFENHIHEPVEKHLVIGKVHVPVIVEEALLNAHDFGHERRLTMGVTMGQWSFAHHQPCTPGNVARYRDPFLGSRRNDFQQPQKGALYKHIF